MPNPALVSLTFDDGLRCQFEQAVPILNQYGLPATFFLTANTSPIHIDWHDHPDWRKIESNPDDIRLLKSVAKRGHEIGSHSVWHKVPDPHNPKFRPDFDPKFEAEESRRLIEGWMDEEIASFCYPFCQKPDTLKNAVIAAGYKQARAGAHRAYRPQQSPTDFHEVDCRHVAVDNPEFAVVNGVSYPIGRDGSEDVRGWLQPDWYVLMFHGVGSINDGWWPISVREFTRQMAELAKHRDSGAVEVVTFKDGADRLRQNEMR
jgi:peptidoglycan/xylan/chitin deacetylase (PgdA/CDA1 family)